MGSIADWAENKIVEHLFDTAWGTAPNIYMALSSGTIADDETGMVEQSGSGYARLEFTDWSTASARKIYNSQKILFAAATANWTNPISDWAIMTALTGGDMIAHGTFTTPRTVLSGNQFMIKAEELEIEFLSGPFTDYLSNALLNFIFNGTAFSQPTIYFGLSSTAPTPAGGNITEPTSGGDYARKAHSSWTITGNQAENNGDITFATCTTPAWGALDYLCVFDALTSGNCLMYDDFTEQTIGVGNVFEIESGDMTVTCN